MRNLYDALPITWLVLSGALGSPHSLHSFRNIEVAINFLTCAQSTNVLEILVLVFSHFINASDVKSTKAFSKIIAALQVFRESPVIRMSIEKEDTLDFVMWWALGVVFKRQVEEFGFSSVCLKCVLQCPGMLRELNHFFECISRALPDEDSNLKSKATAQECFCLECGNPLHKLDGSHHSVEASMITAPIHAGLEKLFMERLCDFSLSTDGFMQFLLTVKWFLLSCSSLLGTNELLEQIAQRVDVLLPFRGNILLARDCLADRVVIHWETFVLFLTNKDCLEMFLAFLKSEITPVSRALTTDDANYLLLTLSSILDICSCSNFLFPEAKTRIVDVVRGLLGM